MSEVWDTGRLRTAAAADGLILRDDAMSLAELDGLLSAWRGDGRTRTWLPAQVAAYLGVVLAADIAGVTLTDDGTVLLPDRSVLDVRALADERLTRSSTDLRGVVREAHARPSRPRHWWSRRR